MVCSKPPSPDLQYSHSFNQPTSHAIPGPHPPSHTALPQPIPSTSSYEGWSKPSYPPSPLRFQNPYPDHQILNVTSPHLATSSNPKPSSTYYYIPPTAPQPNFLLPPFLTSTSFPFPSLSLFFLPPFNNSKCPAFAPSVLSVIAVKPAECFYINKKESISLSSSKSKIQNPQYHPS